MGRTLTLMALLLASATPRSSQAAPRDTVAVIPMHGDRNATEASFATAVRNSLAAANIAVLPGSGTRLLRKAHLRGPQLLRPAAARRFAKRARVGSVLLVQLQRGQRISCILLDVVHGRQVGQWQDLDASDNGADSVSQKVSGMLGGGDMDGGGLGGGDSGSSDTGSSSGSSSGGSLSGGDTGEKTKSSDEPAESTPDSDAPAEASVATDGDNHAGTGKGHGAWRPAFRLTAGILGLQRAANISPQGGVATGAQEPPCYCSLNGKTNPFFPAFIMAIEVFPFAFRGHGAAIEGIGLTAEAVLSQVSTNVGAPPDVVSFLSSGKLGVTYRWVFGSTPLSPDLYLGLGYSAFSFPLAAGQFPGISYSSVYLGAALHVPLFMEQLVGIAVLNIKPGLALGNGSVPALGTSGGGTGVDAALGVRLALDRFELSLLGRIDFYGTSYKGSTMLSGATTQFTNVSLSDRLLEGLLTVGVVF